MDQDAYIVDWAEIQRRHKAGTLIDDWSNACQEERQEDWFTKAEAAQAWAGDSIYMALCDGMDSLQEDDERSAAAEKAFGEFSAVFGRIFTFDDYHKDIEDLGDDFAMNFSPESVKELAIKAKTLDVKRLKLALGDSQELSEAIAEQMDVEEDAALDEILIPYVLEWVAIFQEAAKKGKGLIITWI